jgi:hypothetical protein
VKSSNWRIFSGHVEGHVCIDLTKWSAAFLASAIWALGFVFLSSQPPQPPSQNQSASHAPNETSKGENEKSIWKPNDPVSLYTLVLAFFSGALVIISAIQIRFLILADRTARISAIAARRAANAARKSADVAERALVDIQRALVVPTRFQSDVMVRNKQIIAYLMTAIFENTGTTVAKRFTGTANTVMWDGPLPDTSSTLIELKPHPRMHMWDLECQFRILCPSPSKMSLIL